MVIIDKSVQCITPLFSDLVMSMHGANYQVYLEGKSFDYQQDPYFSIENLDFLYAKEMEEYKDTIDGTVIDKYFREAQQEINRCLKLTHSYNPEGYEDPTNKTILWSINQQIAQQRINTYWEVVQRNIILPPTHTFEHKAAFDSYFRDWLMWGFCFILINDNKKKGIVVSGGAYN